MGAVICVERISRCLEGEYIRGFGSRTIGIQDCGRIFDGYQEGFQRRR